MKRTTPETAFGNRLREHRQKAAMSLKDLADALRVDETSLSKMEQGAERPPDVGTLMRLANTLGVRQGSEEFEQLWTLAEQERHPDQDATAYVASMKDLTRMVLRELVEDLQRMDTPPGADVPVLPIFVADAAAMITQAIEEVRHRPASALTLHFADRTSKTWRVVGTTPERGDV